MENYCCWLIKYCEIIFSIYRTKLHARLADNNGSIWYHTTCDILCTLKFIIQFWFMARFIGTHRFLVFLENVHIVYQYFVNWTYTFDRDNNEFKSKRFKVGGIN